MEDMTVQVAVLDDYQDVARAYADWSDLGAHVQVFHDHLDGHDALVRRLQPFEVVAAMRERTPFPRALLGALPNLRLLVTTGMRNAAIDLEAARDLGITVCGTRAGTEPAGSSTAELTWGLILALARGIVAEERNVREGGWQQTVGTGLAGHTLGLVGLGRIGRQVAAVGRAFGMTVLAWSENLTDDAAHEAGARRVDLQDLFASSDVVSIHTQLSPRTRGVVGAKEIARMHPGAFLVNTSRGPIVDEAALREALTEGRIAGAGLDVFGREPLPPDDPWRSTPRTVLTPHLGYVSAGNYRVFYGDTVECIGAYLAGEPVRVLT
jgi:phosphoglycerate dehydrogenase-like enzyme